MLAYIFGIEVGAREDEKLTGNYAVLADNVLVARHRLEELCTDVFSGRKIKTHLIDIVSGPEGNRS